MDGNQWPMAHASGSITNSAILFYEEPNSQSVYNDDPLGLSSNGTKTGYTPESRGMKDLQPNHYKTGKAYNLPTTPSFQQLQQQLQYQDYSSYEELNSTAAALSATHEQRFIAGRLTDQQKGYAPDYPSFHIKLASFLPKAAFVLSSLTTFAAFSYSGAVIAGWTGISALSGLSGSMAAAFTLSKYVAGAATLTSAASAAGAFVSAALPIATVAFLYLAKTNRSASMQTPRSLFATGLSKAAGFSLFAQAVVLGLMAASVVTGVPAAVVAILLGVASSLSALRDWYKSRPTVEKVENVYTGTGHINPNEGFTCVL